MFADGLERVGMVLYFTSSCVLGFVSSPLCQSIEAEGACKGVANLMLKIFSWGGVSLVEA